jgi:transcriptional regulator with XRE-family HTH domain
MTESVHSASYSKFIAVLVAARRGAGFTQQEIAGRLGKPQSYVAKIEGGERRLDVVEFIALAKAINVNPKTLFASVVQAMQD